MVFILQCLDHPRSQALRQQARVPHLEFVATRSHVFRYGGPLIGDDGVVLGSLMVLDLPDRAALDAHMAADPFFGCGLFRTVQVWQSQQVVPELAPGQLQQELERQRRSARQAVAARAAS